MCWPIHASAPLWSSSYWQNMGISPGLASLLCSIILPTKAWLCLPPQCLSAFPETLVLWVRDDISWSSLLAAPR